MQQSITHQTEAFPKVKDITKQFWSTLAGFVTPLKRGILLLLNAYDTATLYQEELDRGATPEAAARAAFDYLHIE